MQRHTSHASSSRRVLVKKRNSQPTAPNKARGHFDPITVDSPRSSLSTSRPPPSSTSTSTSISTSNSPPPGASYSYNSNNTTNTTHPTDNNSNPTGLVVPAHAVPPQPGRSAPVLAPVAAPALSAPDQQQQLVHPSKVSPADLSDLLSDLNAASYYQTDFSKQAPQPQRAPPTRPSTEKASTESLQARIAQTLRSKSSGLSSDRPSAVANPAVRFSQNLTANGPLMDEQSMARAEPSGMRSPRQRYSDESREGKAQKKKSGFSNFVNNLVGTQRKPTISAPENPVHVTHVGYDQETGEFTVGTDKVG